MCSGLTSLRRIRSLGKAQNLLESWGGGVPLYRGDTGFSVSSGGFPKMRGYLYVKGIGGVIWGYVGLYRGL